MPTVSSFFPTLPLPLPLVRAFPLPFPPLVVSRRCRAKSPPSPISLEKSKKAIYQEIYSFLDKKKYEMISSGIPLRTLDWFLDESMRKARVAILKQLKKENDEKDDDELVELTRESMDIVWAAVYNFRREMCWREMRLAEEKELDEEMKMKLDEEMKLKERELDEEMKLKE